jgi:phage-related minor tail protein
MNNNDDTILNQNTTLNLNSINDIRFALDDLDKDSQRIINKLNSSFATTFRSITTGSKNLESIMQKLLADIAKIAAQAAVNGLLNTVATTQINPLNFSILPKFAKGAAINEGRVVNTPTLFHLNNQQPAIMGEAGAEAILPLTKDSSGRLGIRTLNSNDAIANRRQQKRNINFNITINAIDSTNLPRATDNLKKEILKILK